MHVQESLNVLMSRLGNRTDPDLRQACLREMKLAQESLEASETLPWFLLSETTFARTEAGERRIPLPPDFLRESEEQELVVIVDDVRVTLPKGDYDTLRAEAEGITGVPQAYTLRGQYLVLFPTPDAEYSVEFSSYYARQEPPSDTADSQNAWFKNFPDLMMARAGLVIASMNLKDGELTALFDGLLKEAQRRLFHAEVAREEANRTRMMEDD